MEDTREEAHIPAFHYLRDKARSAHESGDGLLVAHICSIALESIPRLLGEHCCTSDVRDIRWALMLPLYWHTDSYVLDRVVNAMHKVKKSRKERDPLITAMDCLVFLLQQSLHPATGTIEDLKALDISWVDPDGVAEDIAFLSLAVELAFFRQPGGPDWVELADIWIKKSPPIHAKQLISIRNRLQLEAAALYPGLVGGIGNGNAENLPATERELYGLWEAVLQRKWNALDMRLEQMVASSSLGSQGSLAVFDMGRTSLGRVLKGDAQLVSLSRRRLVSSGRYGALEHQVDDYRKAAFYRELGVLWQSETERGAIHRFACFRLAMLNEISALRQWNLPVWFESVHQQALACLEIVRVLGDKPDQRRHFAKEAFRLLVLSQKVDDKDPNHRWLAALLDNTAPSVRTNLIREMICLPPYFWPAVMRGVFLLRDAIPEESLVHVAKWCTLYDSELVGQLEWRPNWLTFWGDILGFIEDNKSICRVLKPLFLRAAGDVGFWTIDSEHALQKYLESAPTEMATGVGCAMFEVSAALDETSNSTRWAIVYNASKARMEIGERFREDLIRTASTPLLGFYANILDEPEKAWKPKDDPQAREWLREQIRNQAREVMGRTGRRIGLLSSVNYRLAGMLTWPDREGELIEDLIGAIESVHVLHRERAEFILCLSELVLRNPTEHLRLVIGPFKRWLEEIPLSDEPFTDVSGPLSPSQINMLGPDIVYVALSRLAEVMCELDAEEVGPVASGWLLSKFPPVPAGVAGALFRLTVVLGVSHEFIERADLLGLILLIVQQALVIPESEQKDGAAAAALISQIAGLLDPQCTGVACLAQSKSPERAQMALNTVGRFLPVFARHPNVDVRMSLARLLRNWEASKPAPFPRDLADVLLQLRNDGRARVRFFAAPY